MIRPFCSAKSGDPDQMQRCTASHLGLCCLPLSSPKKDIRLIWNKQISLHTFLSYKFSDVNNIIFAVGQSEIQSKKRANQSTDNMKLYKIHDAWILKKQIAKGVRALRGYFAPL